MSKLLARLSDAAKSGVYAAPHAADILDATRGSGLRVAPIDLAGVTEKDALLERVSAALQFPGWFGRNWDALEDCLADLSWLEGKGHVLLLEQAGGVKAADRNTVKEILGSVASGWAKKGRPFFAVLVGGEAGLPELYRPRK